MLPADGLGAPPPNPHDDTDAAERRLAAALDRIASALVHRAERDAVARDSREHGPEERMPGEALDADAAAELRDRVDAAIGRVRAALGEGGP